jgi:hypothetical protein
MLTSNIQRKLNLNIKEQHNKHATSQQGAYLVFVYVYIGLCGSQMLVVIFKRACKKIIINA